MAVSVALLAYQEAENLSFLLPEIIEKLKRINEDYEIIVVDTEKPLDNTEEICRQFDNIVYINQKYPKFGGALKTAIECASYDKFLIMDSDGSHNPDDIPRIYEMFMTGADVVIGSRYVAGGVTNDSKLSVLMSRFLNFIFRNIIGVKTKDISTDFRMYDTKQIKNLKLTCENYEVLQEILLYMKLNNRTLVIKEVPIVFNKRVFGKSKRKLLKFIICYLKNIFKLMIIKCNYKTEVGS